MMGRRPGGVKRLQSGALSQKSLPFRTRPVSMNVLAIDTSTEYCSIALDCGDRVHSRHVRAGNTHSEIALPLLDELLREAGMTFAAVDAIAYGEGPGSFTGLRIGAGIVQGLALSRGLKVLGISTLEVLAEAATMQDANDRVKDANTRVIACLDARMSEIYHAAYVRDGDGWRTESAPGVFPPKSAPSVQGEGWTGAGSGFSAYAEILAARYGAQIARVLPDVWPTATALLRLAGPRLLRGEGGDAASAVPIYLRDKVALKTSERA